MTTAVIADVHARLARSATPPGRVEVERAVHAAAPLLGRAETDAVVGHVLARLHGLGALEPLLADPDTTEVMVVGGGSVWTERHGRLTRTDLRLGVDEVTRIAERIVAPLGLQADRRTPLVDARLPDGSRVHVVMPPLAVDGPYLTIRRFRAAAHRLDAFAGPAVIDLLTEAIHGRANLVVSGATSAGKTSLLNALCGLLPEHERVVTVEDAAELRLPGDHVLRLETRPATPDGLSAVTVRELVRNALRMRPDRIVVGEVRGPEALDMVQALNTGHDGSLSTCHANGPVDAVHRIETMAATAGVDLPGTMLRRQVHRAVDLVVHVRRGPDGRRCVDTVHEVSLSSDDEPTRALAVGDDVVGRPTRVWTTGSET